MIPYLASLRRGAVALAACLLVFSTAAFAADDTRSFDVPAGAAAQTLKQFATQAGRDIVFAPEVVGGVQTNAVQGQFTPQDAIDRMLANTALIASQDQTGAFAVRRRAVPSAAAVADPAPAAARPGDEVVKLSPFEVSSEVKGRYEALDEASGGRVRISLMDAPQSVTVVTHELIEDVGATRILDAAKYAAGVTESTIPNAQDRTNIRGFQTDGATIDGFNFFSFSNLDPAIIDRLEIVKGPDAILSPQIVSGTLNVVSKKPVFADQGSADIQVGRYDANRAEFDVNQEVNSQFAVRVVGAAEHAHDLAGGSFNHSQLIMPMFTYRIGANTQVTAQVQAYNSYNAAYGGVPVNFAVGTNDPISLLPGVPKTLDFYGTELARHAEGQHTRLFLETQPTEEFSSPARAQHHPLDRRQRGPEHRQPDRPHDQHADRGDGHDLRMVQLNPNTGAWVWTGQTIANPVFNEQPTSGSWGFQTRRYLNLQNDYSYHVKFGDSESTTVAGYMVDYLRTPGWAYNFTVPNMKRAQLRARADDGLADGKQRLLQHRLGPAGLRHRAAFALPGQADGLRGRRGILVPQYTSDLFHRTTSQNKVHSQPALDGADLPSIPEVAFFADTSRQSSRTARRPPRARTPSPPASSTSSGCAPSSSTSACTRP